MMPHQHTYCYFVVSWTVCHCQSLPSSLIFEGKDSLLLCYNKFKQLTIRLLLNYVTVTETRGHGYKTFAMVIYWHSMLLLSFYVMKQYYCSY
jgi:hypothetical protein